MLMWLGGSGFLLGDSNVVMWRLTMRCQCGSGVLTMRNRGTKHNKCGRGSGTRLGAIAIHPPLMLGSFFSEPSHQLAPRTTGDHAEHSLGAGTSGMDSVQNPDDGNSSATVP